MPRCLFRSVRLASLVAVAMSPTAVMAHAILLSSTPRAGGTVEAGQTEVELRFNSRIDRERSLLQLAFPDKSRRSLPTVPSTPPDTLRAGVELAPGSYILRWQVLATDGHLTRGEVPFSVTPRR